MSICRLWSDVKAISNTKPRSKKCYCSFWGIVAVHFDLLGKATAAHSFGWAVLPVVPQLASSGIAWAAKPPCFCRGSLMTRELATWWYFVFRLDASQVWCSRGGRSASQPRMNFWKRRCRSVSSWLKCPEVGACQDGASLCSLPPARNPLLNVEIIPVFSDREAVLLQNTVCITCLSKWKKQGFELNFQVNSIATKN